jgi:Phosphotransferase enzyme family
MFTSNLELEAFARSRCEALGGSWTSTLMLSVRKQTVTAKVQFAERAAVFKCVAPGGGLTQLESEIHFYQEAKFELAPGLLRSGADFLVVEFLEGQALRRWLAQAPRTTAEVVPRLETVFDGLAARRRPAVPKDAVWAARRTTERVYNLLLSGPYDTRRSPLASTVATRTSKLGVPLLRRALVPLYASWAKRGVAFAADFGHNDLHGDNVLLVGDEARVIDFERVTYPGCWFADALYLFATSYATVQSAAVRKALLECVVNYVGTREPETRREFPVLARVFAGAALSNSRFRGTSWYGGENARSLAELLAAV